MTDITPPPEIEGDDVADLRAEFAQFKTEAQRANRRRDLMSLLIVVAVVLGAIVLYAIIDSRDQRRKTVNDKLHDLACLGLAYIPDTAPAARQVQEEFLGCPRYTPIDLLPTTPAPSKKLSPTATAPNATRRNAAGVVVPSPSPTRSAAPSAPSGPSRTPAVRGPETTKPRPTPVGGESSGATAKGTGVGPGPSPTTVAPKVCVLGLLCLSVPPILSN